jgi:hypothetical protein
MSPGNSNAVETPPVKSPFSVNAKGVITSVAWLTWLMRLVRGANNAGDTASTSLFGDSPRDWTGAINQAGVERDPDGGRFAGDVAEARIRDAAADVAPRADLTGLEASLAMITSDRPGTEHKWFADTHANRVSLYPAAAYVNGSRFFESDRNVVYICVNSVWQYADGIFACTFANAPADLGSNDAGFLCRITTGTGGVAYNHLVRWNGTGYEAADSFGGYFMDFAVAPTESGWQICDGTATKVLQISSGALVETAFTTPNLTGGAYRKSAAAGGYTGSITAAGSATFTGTAGTTGNDNAGGGNSTGSGSQSVSIHPHQHSFTPAGTVSFSGDPVANIAAPTYFRR